MHSLSEDEIRRYQRHLIMPEIGIDGQKKLKAASVAVVGAGGLGSPLAMYLAAAGVGRMGLIDDDVVDESNLQRQIMHGQSTLGRKKVESAAQRLSDINPFVDITLHDTRLTRHNAEDILGNYDIVADGTDNFPTRYLVNDACVFLKKINVFAGIFQFEGQLSVFDAQRGPCYRCLYPEPPPAELVPSCADAGVLGVLPGIMGALQAAEVIKLIVGIGKPMVGQLLVWDALDVQVRTLTLHKDPACCMCGHAPRITQLIDYEQFCQAPRQDRLPRVPSQGLQQDITPLGLKERMAQGGVCVVDVREPFEWEICHIDGALLIPLGQLMSRLDELDKDAPIVVHCKLGGRSRKAQQQLQAAGFTQVMNMQGGICAWRQSVDPSLTAY